MGAKEMFEKLGYHYFENGYLIYLTKGDYYPIDRISFIKDKKEIAVEKITLDKTLSKRVSPSEIQAINQQCKELGWVKEW